MLSMWKRIMRRPNGISLRECDLIVGFLVSWFLVFGVYALSFEVYSPCIRIM